MEWATADGTAEVGVLLGENEEASEEDTEFGMDSWGKNDLQNYPCFQRAAAGQRD
jgi:hypothetical protein